MALLSSSWCLQPPITCGSRSSCTLYIVHSYKRCFLAYIQEFCYLFQWYRSVSCPISSVFSSVLSKYKKFYTWTIFGMSYNSGMLRFHISVLSRNEDRTAAFIRYMRCIYGLGIQLSYISYKVNTEIMCIVCYSFCHISLSYFSANFSGRLPINHDCKRVPLLLKQFTFNQ